MTGGTPAPDEELVAIILHSGAYDRVSYALSLALIALASGMEAHMLVTFEGLLRFVRGRLETLGEETPPQVRASIERGLVSGGIQSLESRLAEAKKLGLKVHACPSAMASLNVSVSELRDEVDDVMGLAAFLALARTATINWYI